MLLSSCANDDEMLPESAVATPTSWIEPYHVKDASPKQVKEYMSASRYDLILSEQSSAYAYQLVYSDSNNAQGILYSFTTLDMGLYSVIDTEPMRNWNIIQRFLERTYHLIDSTSDYMMFTDSIKSTIVTMSKLSDEYLNLTYGFALLYTL